MNKTILSIAILIAVIAVVWLAVHTNKLNAQLADMTATAQEHALIRSHLEYQITREQELKQAYEMLDRAAEMYDELETQLNECLGHAPNINTSYIGGDTDE